MRMMKLWVLSLAAASFLSPLSHAEPSALGSLKELAPMLARAHAAPQPAARAVTAIPPGQDIAPLFSDPGRVKLILKTVEAVYTGGALPFPKDGAVWQNREGRLPAKPAGYYHEYTLLPPAGSPSMITVGGATYRISPPQGRRGAERLIIGGGEVLYYSPDHYVTFVALQVLR